VSAAARELGIAPSTLLRWLNDGFVAGEQVTPGAPWRVRVTGELRGMLTDNAPDGWLALHHASRALGVSRQAVLQKVKRGELHSPHPHRTQERPAYRSASRSRQPVLTATISKGAV
jgi:predicted site-specific integrase-resolvase